MERYDGIVEILQVPMNRETQEFKYQNKNPYWYYHDDKWLAEVQYS